MAMTDVDKLVGVGIVSEQAKRIVEVAQGGTATVSWGDVTEKPTTFAPIIGTGATQAMAGNTAIPEAPGDIGAATAAQGALAATAVQPGDLAPVATSGAYGDLTGAPDIPTVSFATISALSGDWRGEGAETLADALAALQAGITS